MTVIIVNLTTEEHMTREEAVAKIAELTKAAMQNIKEAEKLAEEHKVEFSFGVAYGMGGHYYPISAKSTDEKKHNYENDYGWVSSSSNC